MVAQSDDCCYGPTFIGDCPPSIPGPPGPSGDRYLTSFTKKIHKYVLDTGSIGLQLEPNLAYIHGQSIYCVHDTVTAPFDYFKGTVKTYHPATGLMHVEHIHSVSCDFEYSTTRTYKINIDYSTCADEDIAHNHSITLDNTTDDRNYIAFSAQTQGPLYPKTSHDLSFVPNTGELYTNVVYESKQANTITPLAPDDALNFVKKLQPKQFSQQSEIHYGFLAEDIAQENPGIAKNNSISYSDFCAPIISVVQTLVDKMSQMEIKMAQMEQRLNQLAEYQQNDHHSYRVISMSGIHRRAFCMEDGKHRPAHHHIKPPVPDCKPTNPPVPDCKPTTNPPVPECKPPAKPPVPECKPHQPTCPNPYHYSKEELYALASMVDYIVPGDEKVSLCEIKQVEDVGDVIHLIAEATRKYNLEHPTKP